MTPQRSPAPGKPPRGREDHIHAVEEPLRRERLYPRERRLQREHGLQAWSGVVEGSPLDAETSYSTPKRLLSATPFIRSPSAKTKIERPIAKALSF